MLVLGLKKVENLHNLVCDEDIVCPSMVQAFYMRVNDDDRTVAAMDMLVPRVGELMGGSQREERAEVLSPRSTQ